MRPLKRVENNIDKIKTIIKNSAPVGYGMPFRGYNIHIEHYSSDNTNRLVFDNEYHCAYAKQIPYRVTISKQQIKIIFHSPTPRGSYFARKYDIKKHLYNVYADWINDDMELWHLLQQTL